MLFVFIAQFFLPCRLWLKTSLTCPPLANHSSVSWFSENLFSCFFFSQRTKPCTCLYIMWIIKFASTRSHTPVSNRVILWILSAIDSRLDQVIKVLHISSSVPVVCYWHHDWSSQYINVASLLVNPSQKIDPLLIRWNDFCCSSNQCWWRRKIMGWRKVFYSHHIEQK